MSRGRGNTRGAIARRVLLGIALIGTTAASVLALVACGYLALPGGWIINFPGFSGAALGESELQQRIAVPDGFAINTYTAEVPNARMLLFTATGDLLVSTPRSGEVLLLERDRDGDGVADGRRVLLAGLDRPHGLAYHDGWLYVAETSAVLRVRFDPETGSISGTPEQITGLPGGGNHWTRTIHVGPDEMLYVSVGSSCNVCIERDARRATILRYPLGGGGGEIYASGLRNAVDFAWQPGTGELYATDNGRDLLGDDFPPDELNRIVRGGFYGWPVANGNRIPDPDQGAGQEDRIAASLPPVHEFGAHVATLGITFYKRRADAPAAFPSRYDGVAFVAQHGSWNRSKKSGYQVVMLRLDADGMITETPFATGFLRDEHVAGRPVGVAVGPDGALYVSDDYAGAVYRIAYGSAARGHRPVPDSGRAPAPQAAMSATELETAATRGHGLWAANGCPTCHAPGQDAPEALRPLNGLRRRYTIDSLAAFLLSPQPPMPPVTLSAPQRRDLAAYLLLTYP